MIEFILAIIAVIAVILWRVVFYLGEPTDTPPPPEKMVTRKSSKRVKFSSKAHKRKVKISDGSVISEEMLSVS